MPFEFKTVANFHPLTKTHKCTFSYILTEVSWFTSELSNEWSWKHISSSLTITDVLYQNHIVFKFPDLLLYRT